MLEVPAPGRRRRVVDLADVIDALGADCSTRPDPWLPVSVHRGFAPLVAVG